MKFGKEAMYGVFTMAVYMIYQNEYCANSMRYSKLTLVRLRALALLE